MRRLTLVAVFLLTVSCRPRDHVILESPRPEILQSAVHMADPGVTSQLIRGFHELEQNSWRWTAGAFSIAFGPPADSRKRGGHLVLRCSVPEALISRVGNVTLTARLDGKTLGTLLWKQAGEYTFTAPIPASLLQNEIVTIDFSLNPFLKAGQAETRELGLIVSSAEITVAP